MCKNYKSKNHLTMKNLMSLSKLFLALGVIFFASSCDPDSTDPVVINPSSFLESGTGLISEATTIDPGTIINVRLSATAGDNEMNTLTVRQDGDLLETSRYTVDGLEINNPALLFDSDRSSFVYDIAITPHDAGVATYEFIVASETAGDDDVTSLDITITEGVLSLVIDGPTSITLDDASLVEVDLVAAQGGSALNTLAVLENGSVITDLSRLRYGDVGTSFDSNPFVLPADDKAGFVKSIFISSQTSPGTSNYSIVLEDEAGNQETVTYDMILNAQATALTNEFFGVPLFNNSGSGFGTINLDLGTNETSVNNPNSDIKDSGNVGGVWDQTIEPVNGAALRILSSQSTYTYGGIGSRESLVAAWDEAGGDLSLSGTITVGSTYMARVGAADYYVFTCTAVNDTGSANTQNYTFDIKQSQL